MHRARMVYNGGELRIANCEWRMASERIGEMDECPICKGALRDALVICGHCGEVLPLRVVVVSEGSRGGGFALVENTDKQDARYRRQEEEVNGE